MKIKYKIRLIDYTMPNKMSFSSLGTETYDTLREAVTAADEKAASLRDLEARNENRISRKHRTSIEVIPGLIYPYSTKVVKCRYSDYERGTDMINMYTLIPEAIRV